MVYFPYNINMYLLAVSGGPDSMFLLNEYKNKKIIVAHVNYNLRKSSTRDQKIVEVFCNKNNIELRTLVVKTKPSKNTEAWARKIRYDFFKEIYDEFKCSALMTGHHRDDFLETALMQQSSGRVPEFFGIRKKRTINEMVVIRPFIHLYWKDEIVKELDKKNIEYGIDETNEDIKFTRNAIRAKVKTWPIKEKRYNVSWFKMSNKILKKKHKRIISRYSKWEKSNFSIKHFRNIDKYKEEIVFKFIHIKFGNIKLSKEKLNSIISFIEGKDSNKIFKLNANVDLTKKNGIIY